MITGAAQMDGAILVVNAADGPMLKLENTWLLALKLVSQHGFLNKIDTVKDKELVDLVEEEIREFLTSYKFGDKIPIVKGSALMLLKAKMKQQVKCNYGINEGCR